jgi:glucosyl-dolichyl phosphate glucuronosyltransferase
VQVDVIIPTHNRAALLPDALRSLLNADRSEGLSVTVIVVDNCSTDATPQIVAGFVPEFEGRLRYIYEPKPGRSHALNAGIAAARGELVAMIDDDEQVDRGWLLVIEKAFQAAGTDFIGGPYLPIWGAPRPVWLTNWYRSAAGWVDPGDTIQPFGPPFEAMLMGGNAVIRRSVLQRVGPYAVDLGRTPGGRLLSCEDEDMFARLLLAGAKGYYRPDLIIHHHVTPERLTKSYFRRWCFWRAVSQAVMDRRRPSEVRHVFSVPRYMIGIAVRETLYTIRFIFRDREPARLFKNELAWWDLAGFLYGRHCSALDRWLCAAARYLRADAEVGSGSAATGRRQTRLRSLVPYRRRSSRVVPKARKNAA